MDENFRNQLINNLNLKPIEELLEIWKTNDRVEWTDEAFEVIQQILLERLGYVPPQNSPITKYIMKKSSLKEIIIGFNPIALQISFVGVLLLYLQIIGEDSSKYPILTTIFVFLALGLLGLSGVIIIIRKEYPRSGFPPVKGVFAIISGVLTLLLVIFFAWVFSVLLY